MKKNKRLEIRLSEDDERYIHEQAQQAEISVSEFGRLAMLNYNANQAKKDIELANALPNIEDSIITIKDTDNLDELLLAAQDNDFEYIRKRFGGR